MAFKFFRPWEDNGEASTSQAKTHHHGSAAQASEAEKQPQVHSGWILQPAQRADPANSLLSLEPLAGSIRIDDDASKSDGDTDCHGDSRTQEHLHDLDNTWKSTCSANPSTHRSGTRLPFIVLRDDPSLAYAAQIISTQKVTSVVESFMTPDSSRSSSSPSCPSNSATESDVRVNVSLDRTQNSGQNLAIAKGSNGLDDSTCLNKAYEVKSEHLPLEQRQNEHDIATSNNVDGQKCPTLSKSFRCISCDKAFSRSSDMHVHEQIHAVSKPFKCRFCEKHFKQVTRLRGHERTHTGSKPFKCTVCMKAYTESSSLRVHERIHTGSRPFQCKICEKKFARSYILREHERIHTGSKPFKCRFCKKSFTHYSSLHKHERTHTGIKPFKCTICTKAFTQSSSLRVHERIHSGYRPFQCRICGKGFAGNSDLQRHECTHTGYKPFKCRICEKSFTRSSSLHAHEQTQKGCKPFKCTFCMKAFTRSSNLQVHERSHT